MKEAMCEHSLFFMQKFKNRLEKNRVGSKNLLLFFLIFACDV